MTTTMKTQIFKIPHGATMRLGEFVGSGRSTVDEWRILPDADAQAVAALERAAAYLRTKDVPVAFPTETVYGLGADATRSAAVRGIYAAKGRPLDNPLIVHVADLAMLRDLLGAGGIPERYEALIERFWPGPLTILLPNAKPSRLAGEVTAGLGTFGVRMPSSPLALSLIKLAGTPLAAPSANASTRPSPTTAQHVADDLGGRIELVLDGGACAVGVESTVVDGLCDPPVVLRPGGVGMDELRACPGWEGVVAAYRDRSEEGAREAPRAPGMKYKHYSPRAGVVLYEASHDGPLTPVQQGKVGVIRTRRWKRGEGFRCAALRRWPGQTNGHQPGTGYEIYTGDLDGGELFDIDLGEDTRGIAHGLFAALRELDGLGVEVIYVDGIQGDLDIAAAVMNRLRKAASEIRA